MNKIKFRTIVSIVVASVAMLAGSFSYAGGLGDIVGDYLTGRQMNKRADARTSLAQGAMQTFGNNDQMRLKGIELTPEWTQIFNMAVDATQKVNENLINAGQQFDFCENPNVLYQMNDEPKRFDFNVNSKLPHQASKPSNLFDFSTLRELNRFNSNYTGLEPVHIPHGNAVNSILRLSNDGNAYQNGSAIMLPKQLANEVKRQYMLLGRNPMVDSRDMYMATLRDIATIGYIINANPQLNISFDNFFIASMMVYSRNKVLCLYDLPIRY